MAEPLNPMCCKPVDLLIILVTKFLSSITSLTWITESLPEYGQAAKVLSEEAIKKITSPTHLSPLQQECLSVHYKLNHLPFIIMIWLEKWVSFLAASSNLGMIYHLAYLLFLGKIISGPGVTNHQLSLLKGCFHSNELAK